jgi:hypothetical protein
MNNEGSQRLIRAASEHGAEQLRGRRLPTKQVERRRRAVCQRRAAEAKSCNAKQDIRWQVRLRGTRCRICFTSRE